MPYGIPTSTSQGTGWTTVKMRAHTRPDNGNGAPIGLRRQQPSSNATQWVMMLKTSEQANSPGINAANAGNPFIAGLATVPLGFLSVAQVSRSSSLEADETRDLYDKRSGLSAWDTFLQRALDPDFLAKKLSI